MRVAKQLVWRTFFFDLSLLQKDHMVRHISGKPHIMRDQNHCAAFFGKRLDYTHDLLFQFGVKRRCGFIKQQGTRFHAQRPRNRRALLLATRQHGRIGRGQVPTLVLDDGTAISETVSICRYFEELHPIPPMFGTTAVERAHIDMWIRRVEFNLMAPVGNFWRHAHPRTAALLTQFKDFGESNRAAYASVLKWLDGELADRPFLAGQTYTMADICALTTIDFASWIGLAMEGDIPNVAAWHARVTARPSAQA